MRKFLIVTLVLFLCVGLFFANNIYGYFRFKSYCSNEGGLRIYEPLEKNVGWFAKDKYDAKAAAQLKYVGFVRYTDKDDGKLYDIKFLGKDPQWDGSFERTSADESREVLYKWVQINEDLSGRLAKLGYEVIHIKSEKMLVRYYMFGYSKFDRSHTILDAPTAISCFHEGGRNLNDPSRWLEELNTAFKN